MAARPPEAIEPGVLHEHSGPGPRLLGALGIRRVRSGSEGSFRPSSLCSRRMFGVTSGALDAEGISSRLLTLQAYTLGA